MLYTYRYAYWKSWILHWAQNIIRCGVQNNLADPTIPPKRYDWRRLFQGDASHPWVRPSPSKASLVTPENFNCLASFDFTL